MVIFADANGGRYAGQIKVVGGSGVFSGFINFQGLCLALIAVGLTQETDDAQVRRRLRAKCPKASPSIKS